jgi:hypothetical protein
METQSIENAQETYDGHSQGIDPESLRSEDTGKVDLEDITKHCRENRPREDDSGLPGNAAYFRPEAEPFRSSGRSFTG